jgi:aromatic ring-cleaving dioxygenase
VAHLDLQWHETMTGGGGMMTDAPKDMAAITDYHAHIYYDPASKDRAATLRRWVEERFPGQMRMGSWHDEPVGPHVQAMYQIAFPPELLPTLVPFLMMNRIGLTILLHPQSGRPRDDHTVNAVWMGQVLPVKTEVLREVG